MLKQMTVAVVSLCTFFGAASAASEFYFRTRPALIDNPVQPQRSLTIAIGSGALDTLYADEPAELSFFVSGGTGPYSWTLEDAPDGLSINSSGMVSGVPTTTGAFDHVKVSAFDSTGLSSSFAYPLNVVPALLANNPGDQKIAPGESLSLKLDASGGVPPLTWMPIDIPVWASLSTSGDISGEPTTGTSFDFSVKVSDARGTERNVAFKVSVAPRIWVAVGSGGTILTSEDAATWTSRTSGTTASLRDVENGNGLWVASGDGGTIRTSPDGKTWTSRSSGITGAINDVDFEDGRWYAFGDGGMLATSLDGISWSASTTNFPDGFKAAAYADGVWVAGGKSGTMAVSTNGGQAWTKTAYFSSATNNSVDTAEYLNGRWLLGTYYGELATSADGFDWTKRTSAFGTATNGSSSIRGYAYGNGTFAGAGQAGNLVSSSDGMTWTLRPRPAGMTTYGFYTVTFGAGRFIAAGEQGKAVTSTDGIVWTTLTLPTTALIFGLAYD